MFTREAPDFWLLSLLGVLLKALVLLKPFEKFLELD